MVRSVLDRAGESHPARRWPVCRSTVAITSSITARSSASLRPKR